MTNLKKLTIIYAALVLYLTAAAPAEAYIGPGAGFAFLYSFFVVFLILFIAPLFILAWPVWYLFHMIKTGGGPKNARVKRVVILGLDGLDPDLVEKFFGEDKLPNFRRLAETGSFKRLGTTHPSVSPVAWSSFQTGVNPSKHNIFDFLDRDPNTNSPRLSSAYIGSTVVEKKFGPFKYKKNTPVLRLNRKSQPFWKILGDKGVFSTVLRVPITFPPEKFYGVSLSAMCVPDLKGTQGTFTCFQTGIKMGSSSDGVSGEATGGVRIPVVWNKGIIDTNIPGPMNSMVDPPVETKLPLRIIKKDDGVQIKVMRKNYFLREGDFTPWISLSFKIKTGVSAAGIVKFSLTKLEPELILYMTPINIDPEKPSLPVSHPLYYSVYLAKLLGPYATLGLAEDTWALNEGALTDESFLKQTWANHEEREKMFFHSLKMTRKGLAACVFDTSDRIQHMFWRHLEADHPANLGVLPPPAPTAIEEMYIKMDDLLGRTLQHIGPKDVLMVVSDHGFKPFRRCFNVNSWLKQNGYLYLHDGTDGGDFFQDVDWTRTKAYGVGLGGIYINLQGREKNGIVVKGEEALKLKAELKAKLTGMKDPLNGQTAINRIFDIAETGQGPYAVNGPDLLFGFNPGWRISWESVTGDTTGEIFSDNIKKWSGDHCVDPEQAPGIFFANKKIGIEDPDLRDISATCLDLFAVPVPDYIEGRAMMKDVKL